MADVMEIYKRLIRNEEDALILVDLKVLPLAKAVVMASVKDENPDAYVYNEINTLENKTIRSYLYEAVNDLETVSKYFYIPASGGGILGKNHYYVKIGSNLYFVALTDKRVIAEFIRKVNDLSGRVVRDYSLADANIDIRHVDGSTSAFIITIPAIHEDFEANVNHVKEVVKKFLEMPANGVENALNDWQRAFIRLAERNGWQKRVYPLKVSLVKGDYYIHVVPDIIMMGFTIRGSRTPTRSMFVTDESGFNEAVEYLTNTALFWDDYFALQKNYALFHKTGFIRPSTKVFAKLKNELVKPDHIDYYYLKGTIKRVRRKFRTADEIPKVIFKVSTRFTKGKKNLLANTPDGLKIRVEGGYVFHPLSDAVPLEFRYYQLLVLKELAEVYGDVDLVIRRFAEATGFDVNPAELKDAIENVESKKPRRVETITLDSFIKA